MKQKRNDSSIYYADWTTKKLKEWAVNLDELIYGENPCYGISDMRMLDGILLELDKRGVKVGSKLTFN